MAEYRLTPKAQRDLDEIVDYTATNWGLSQAMRYADLIERALIELADAPQRPKVAPRFGPVIGGVASSSTSSISGLLLTASPSSASCINAWTRPAICRR